MMFLSRKKHCEDMSVLSKSESQEQWPGYHFLTYYYGIFLSREALDVNDALMELFILAYACRTSCARRITGRHETFLFITFYIHLAH